MPELFLCFVDWLLRFLLSVCFRVFPWLK